MKKEIVPSEKEVKVEKRGFWSYISGM